MLVSKQSYHIWRDNLPPPPPGSVVSFHIHQKHDISHSNILGHCQRFLGLSYVVSYMSKSVLTDDA